MWDAHSAQLAQLVSDASGGLARAADRYRKMGVPADDPGGQRSVAPHVRNPRRVSGYVDAIALSDLVTTGRAKLAEADERAKTYPIDVAEAMFAAIRPMLENAKKDKRGGQGDRSPRRRGRTQARGGPPPAARRDPPVAAVRPGGRPAPARPAPDRARRASTETTLIANLDAVDEVWGLLDKHLHSQVPLVTDKEAQYFARKAKLDDWRAQFEAAHDDYRKGKFEEAKKRLAAIQKGAFMVDLRETLDCFDAQERKDQLWGQGVKIALLVGIGLVSGGVGAEIGAVALGVGWSSGPPRSRPRRPRRLPPPR